MPPLSFFPFSLMALTLAGLAASQQAQQQGGQARAEAHATAQGGESKSATHRVVVVNGKTVVDERTENGKPVGNGGGAGLLPPLPLPAGDNADQMLRRLQDEVRRQLEQQGTPPMPQPTGESADQMLRRLQDEVRRQLEQQGTPPMPQPPVPPPVPPTRHKPAKPPVPRRA